MSRRARALAGIRSGVVAIALGLATGAADAACRQALALGLDVSGSVDADEYRLQLGGLSDALTRPSVREALLAMPASPVEIAVFEWSGPDTSRLLQPWRAIVAASDIDAVASRIRGTRRVQGDTSTALGGAMRYGARLLAQRPDCWRAVLDVSGDGKSNTGPRPRDVRRSGTLGDATLNALVIGADDVRVGDARQAGIAELSAYFAAEVIHGPDAFVETALGFRDYADAMERKLLRELRVLTLGAAPDAPLPPGGAAPRQ